MKLQNFSVCMSVYKNDNSIHFKKAMESVIHQTVVPNEIVLVIDGPVLFELKETILELVQKYSFIKPIWLKENVGLGNALAIGVKNSEFDIIARMDSDDIAVQNRFETQLLCLQNNSGVSIVGGSIYEFSENTNVVVGIRELPKSNAEIYKYLKRRCPLNHVTVMFRKEHVLKAGNYVECKFNEDYHLWIRMVLLGFNFINLQDNLVFVRTGKEMYARRGGIVYFKSEVLIQNILLKNNLINRLTYCNNIIIRIFIQLVLPNTFRGLFYKYFFRKKGSRYRKHILPID